MLGDYLPPIEVSKGKYLIGTQVVEAQLKGSEFMVGAAGKQVSLAGWYKNNARTECMLINSAAQKGKTNLKGVVTAKLKELKVSEADIKSQTNEFDAKLETEFKKDMQNEVADVPKSAPTDAKEDKKGADASKSPEANEEDIEIQKKQLQSNTR